ncbi:MAG: hypothetical protein IJI44_04800 [Erysipelotrichaceae bacterium]|nr:hypothetical protein [Erysipelotrichaceae bacterium]
MIVLLTGKPGIGKSTALSRITDMLGRRRCAGLLAKEILKDGERVGFSSYGLKCRESVILAHKEFRTGFFIEDFGVDPKALDELCEKEYTAAQDKQVHFMILDEIGRMQMMSQGFKRLLEKMAECEKHLIATICLEDEIEYIREFKKRGGVRLFVLDEDNRKDVPLEVCRLVGGDDEVYLGKIELALKYRNEKERYEYNGDRIVLHSEHGIRTITANEEGYHCTCEYYAQNGICSHILSLLIDERKE